MALFRLSAFLLMAGAALAQTSGHAWRDNLTPADVVKALGKPQSDLSASNREFMNYPNGVRIEFQNGILVNISGVVPEALKPAPPPVVAPAPSEAVAATPAAPAPNPPAVSPAPSAPKPITSSAAPALVTAVPTAATTEASTGDQDSEKIISDYSTSSIVPQGTTMSAVLVQKLGPMASRGSDVSAATASATSPDGLTKGLSLASLNPSQPASVSVWSQPGTLMGFFAGLLLKTVVMTVMLKAVFAYKEFPSVWGEMILVAFGVSLANQVLAYLFTLNDFGKIAAMVQVDQLVAGILLLGLIMKFTAAKQFPTAAGITVAAMAVNVGLSYAQLFFL